MGERSDSTTTGGDAPPDPEQEDLRQPSQGRDADADDAQVPPELLEALRQIGLTGRASLSAAGDAAKSLRTLVAADVSLARSALGRTLALSGLAIACGASSWLFLMGTLVVILNGPVGLSWSVALLIPAAISLLVTAFASWMAVRYFEHTRLQATRRQLARLGIGELADFMPSPGSAESARTRTRQTPDDPHSPPRGGDRDAAAMPP
ncbi:MAG: phage holin family protein [Lysobacter sp.]